jgi:hypothetical protein
LTPGNRYDQRERLAEPVVERRRAGVVVRDPIEAEWVEGNAPRILEVRIGEIGRDAAV